MGSGAYTEQVGANTPFPPSPPSPALRVSVAWFIVFASRSGYSNSTSPGPLAWRMGACGCEEAFLAPEVGSCALFRLESISLITAAP